MVGKTLGHYEILELLGKGGMGEVYRAQDTILERDVAIKVLPKDLATDPDRLARLEREAKLLATLNHPNIATIYSLEQAEGVRFLVLELIKGDSLDRQLAAGPFPVDKALEVCKQIAQALEAAHGEGIIHRDLKPANVHVMPDGRTKVLDFGLAKSFVTDPSDHDGDLSRSPTVSVMGTQAGVILGTAPYMSPEQIRGKALDKRADIWSFGCLLYEVLSGTRAFDRETIADTLAATIAGEPDWTALPTATPTLVQSLLRRCLQKDRDRRLHDIADARIEIEEALVEPEGATQTGAPDVVGPPTLARAIPWVVALVAVTVAVVAISSGRRRAPSTPRPLTRLVVSLAGTEELGRGRSSGQLIALSPDGKHLAYGVGSGSETKLYVRPMDQFDARLIEGTGGAYNAFFSPDSEWLGFFSEGGLKKVSLAGGRPVTLCESCSSNGATWGPDDNIVFGSTGSLWVVSAAGGRPQLLAEPDLERGETSYLRPEILPGGQAVLFELRYGEDLRVSSIAVLPLEGGEPRIVAEEGTDPLYVSTGHVVYARAGLLFARTFDVGSLAPTGDPEPIGERVLIRNSGTADFSISSDGTLAYVPGSTVVPDSGRLLVWVDRHGNAQPLTTDPRTFIDVRVAPDGERVAASISEEGTRNIWVLENETLGRLTWEGDNRVPVWGWDGAWVTFASNRAGGSRDLYRKRADFSGEAEELLTSDNDIYPVSLSPFGRELAFYEKHPETARNILVLPFTGDRAPWTFLGTSANERSPMVSPDGRWLAYVSDRDGQNEIYIEPFPGPGGRRRQVSTDGGREPLWSPNGRELFYRSGSNGEKMMVAEFEFEPSFNIERQLLFEGKYLSNSNRTIYDIHPDGQRFLMIKKQSEPGRRQSINVVLNWFEELKERVPTGR